MQTICTKNLRIVFSVGNTFTTIMNLHRTDILMKRNMFIFSELKIDHFKILTVMPLCESQWSKHLLERSFNFVFQSSSFHFWDWFSFFTVHRHLEIRYVVKRLVLRLWLWQLILVSSMRCEQLSRQLLPGVSFKWQFAYLLPHLCCQLSNLFMLGITIPRIIHSLYKMVSLLLHSSSMLLYAR